MSVRRPGDPVRVLEEIDRRVLAAVRFIDVASGTTVRDPLLIEGAPLTWIRNASGVHVLMDAPGLRAYAATFDPPTAPAPLTSSFTLIVRDPQQRWIPRRFTLRVPRDPDTDATRRDHIDSVYRARDVELYPTPAARPGPAGALLRVVVPETAGTQAPPLRGALVRVLRSADGARIGRGLTNEHGEALVVVPDVPLVGWSPDENTPPVSSTTAVVIQVAANPASEPPDPEALESDWATHHLADRDEPASLEWGREVVKVL